MVKKLMGAGMAALVLSTLPLAAQTQCDRQFRLGGEWRLAPGDEAVCTATIRPGGVLVGECSTQEYDPRTGDWVIERFSLRGSINLFEDCRVRAVFRIPEMEERFIGRGRVWATGGTTPEAGIIISVDDDDPWSATMYKIR